MFGDLPPSSKVTRFKDSYIRYWSQYKIYLKEDKRSIDIKGIKGYF